MLLKGYTRDVSEGLAIHIVDRQVYGHQVSKNVRLEPFAVPFMVEAGIPVERTSRFLRRFLKQRQTALFTAHRKCLAKPADQSIQRRFGNRGCLDARDEYGERIEIDPDRAALEERSL